MEVDLQSLFGLHVTWCAQLYSLAETPHLDSYTRELFCQKRQTTSLCNPLIRIFLLSSLGIRFRIAFEINEAQIFLVDATKTTYVNAEPLISGSGTHRYASRVPYPTYFLIFRVVDPDPYRYFIFRIRIRIKILNCTGAIVMKKF